MVSATIQIKEKTTVGLFNNEDWIALCRIIKKTFNFNKKLSSRLRNSKQMKLIAAIPYLAGCRNPERIALSHLAITIIASSTGKEIFLHNFNDNKTILSRLERISHFPDGNNTITKRGMKLLALIMINDHIVDSSSDIHLNKYNPVNNRIWDGVKIKNNLIKEINEYDLPQMDAILTAYEAEQSFWEVW